MAKRTEITIETDSLFVLRGRRTLRAWCPQCGKKVKMIPLNQTGVISNLTPPEVERWLLSEDLHHTVASDGAPLVCLDSMLKRVCNAKTSS